MAGALAVVLGQPSLWLMGSLAFALRGGLFLLLASVVVLPTPIELRILLGANLGSSGLAPEFLTLLVAIGAGLVLLVVLGLALVAQLELSAFERLVGDPEAAQGLQGREPGPPTVTQRRALWASLFGVQLLAVAALVVAAIPLLSGAIGLTYQEIIRPSVGGTIYVRVLNGLREPLLILLAGLVLVEMVSALATRRLLVRGFGLGGARLPQTALGAPLAVLQAVISGLLRPLRRPIGTLATLVLVWSASLALLVPLSWGLTTAWSSVRAAYLSSAAGRDEGSLASLAVVTLALAALWLAGVALGGFVSALRAALWSADGLR